MISPEEPIPTHDLSPDHLSRRSILGTLSLAGIGMLASALDASAFLSSGRGEDTPKVAVQTRSGSNAMQGAGRIDLTDLPPAWAHGQGAALPAYARYIASLKLNRISTEQVIEAHAKSKGDIWNTLPPKVWWARMGYTLRVADRIAMEMGADQVEIISAYRCPAYNAHCEGAKSGSYHQANVAVDVKFPMRASLVTAAARNLRDRGLFKGGVGGYWNFTHIDTRGENINW